MALVILVILWVILGLIAAAIAPRIFRKPIPLGTGALYAVCVVTVVAVGLVDWLLAFPLVGIQGPLALVGSLAEPFVAAWAVVWLFIQVRPAPAA